MKNLNIKTRCPKPFDTLTVDKDGNCYACECSGWLPVPVGNLKIQTLDQILSGDRIKEIRSSITDGTYRHCQEKLCSWLLDKRTETKVWSEQLPASSLKQLRLGFDDSCNLSCPSCRTKKIFEKRGTRLNSRLLIADKIVKHLENINHPILVHLGSDGDPFASLAYRHFLKKCPQRDNIGFSIQTNGLLVKKMYQRNRWLFDKLQTLGLSIDGCSKETYETLRRGGNFDILKKNLSFIRDIKNKHNFQLIFHCVVQRENFREMENYIQFATEFGADRIWFNRIVDWKTLDNFNEHDVVDPVNTLHKEFIECLDSIRKYAWLDDRKFVEFPTLDIQ